MKNKNLKRNYGFEDDYNFNLKKGSVAKDKGSKKRLSIYEDFQEDEDDFMVHEKFKKKNK
jgi:hypothetical protein